MSWQIEPGTPLAKRHKITGGEYTTMYLDTDDTPFNETYEEAKLVVQILNSVWDDGVKDSYDVVVAEVAKDLNIDEAELRKTFSTWITTSHGSRRDMIAKGMLTELDDARCYSVYRLTKSRSAFNMAHNTIERRTVSTPEQKRVNERCKILKAYWDHEITAQEAAKQLAEVER